MRRLLLDTHVLIWWLSGDETLGKAARTLIANPGNEVYVSAASVWEMSIKRQIGKLIAPLGIDKQIVQAGFLALPISLSHGELAGLLPMHHKDPFDRMIIAQAMEEDLVILTKDEAIPGYEVETVDALI